MPATQNTPPTDRSSSATKQVALNLIREMRWYDEYPAQGRADRAANTTAGNKRGGLANIPRLVAKAGTTALRPARQRYGPSPRMAKSHGESPAMVRAK